MTGAIVATSLVVWPAAPFFLFMHGKDTTIPKGTEITAYVNGESLAIMSSPDSCRPIIGSDKAGRLPVPPSRSLQKIGRVTEG